MMPQAQLFRQRMAVIDLAISTLQLLLANRTYAALPANGQR
jgi:hypothetical protein